MFSNRRLLAQSSLLYFPKLLSWVGSYAAFSLLFRLRGAAEYGDYVILTIYWGIPALFAGDVIGSAGQRLLAEAGLAGVERRNRAFRSTWTIHLAAVVVVGLIALLLLPLVNRYVYQSPILEQHWLLGLVIYVGSASQTFFRYILRGMQMFKQTLAMDMTESLSRNILWIAICAGFATRLSLAGGAAAALVIAMIVIYSLLVQRKVDLSLGPIRGEDGHEIQRQAKAFSIILLSNYALSSVPAIVLNRFHGSEAVGLYSALFRIVDFSTGPILAIVYILAPVATEAKLRGEKEVCSLLARSFKITIFFVPLIVCVALGRSEIVNIFGLGKYPEAPQIVLIFCVYVFFSNFAAIFGTFADFLGYSRARAGLIGIFALLYVCMIPLIAKHGDVKLVALATTLTYGALVTSYLGLIIYHHSSEFIRHNLGLTLRLFACLGIAALIAISQLPLAPPDGIWDNFLSLILRSAVFVLLTAVFGALAILRRENGRLIIR